jgi:hypothetical protein
MIKTILNLDSIINPIDKNQEIHSIGRKLYHMSATLSNTICYR